MRIILYIRTNQLYKTKKDLKENMQQGNLFNKETRNEIGVKLEQQCSCKQTIKSNSLKAFRFKTQNIKEKPNRG